MKKLLFLFLLGSCYEVKPDPLSKGLCKPMTYSGKKVSGWACHYEGYVWHCSYDESISGCMKAASCHRKEAFPAEGNAL